MNKKLLITRPEHDDTTHYISHWSKNATNVAESKGIKILDLPRERSNIKEVTSMISKQEPILIIFNGHGDEDKITGHKNEPLIIAGKNEHLLKGKIIYSISCKSAKILGPKSIDAGAKSFLGYEDDFIFVYDPKKIVRPLDDDTARLFLEPSNELIISLIKGNSAEEAHKRSKQFFQKSIVKALSSEATSEETSMARYLWWDMKQQVCLGDPNSSI